MDDMALAELFAHFRRHDVLEVLVNGNAATVLVLKSTQREILPPPFACSFNLLDQLQQFAYQQHLRLDPLHPAAGGAWQWEELRGRWHAVIPPVAQDGPYLSLRRHQFAQIPFNAICGSETDKRLLAKTYLAGSPILVVGPTGSGKTSLLSALLREYSFQERVIILETLPELSLLSVTWLRLTARGPNLEGKGAVQLEHLLRESLRLYPDRLVIGEVRGDELKVLMRALLSGHGGLLTTIHAGSLWGARQRVEEMIATEDGAIWAEVLSTHPPLIVLMARGEPCRIAATSFWDQI